MNHQKALLIWSPRLKRVKMVLTLFKNGFHSHPNAPENVDGWDSSPDPQQLRRAPFGLACLTRRVENGVIAIQKWVPYTPKCSRKTLAAGAPPQRPRPPIAREMSAFDACQSDTPRGRGADSHPHPGRQKPSVSIAIIIANGDRGYRLLLLYITIIYCIAKQNA